MSKSIEKIIIIAVLVAVAALSFTVVANYATNLTTYEKQLAQLDEKRNTVMTIAGVTLATSSLITFLPDDKATPLANELADIGGYMFIVLCVICLEKYLLVMTGAAAFKVLIPLACGLGIIAQFIKARGLGRIAAKLVAFGIILVFLIPTSLCASSMIENTYESSVNQAVETAQNTNSKIEEIVGADVDEAAIDEIVEQDSNDSKSKTWWEKVKGGAKAVGETAKSAAEGVKNVVVTITNFDIREVIRMVQDEIGDLFEAAAVILITSCGIPILVLVFFVWMLKVFLSMDINIKVPKFRLSKFIEERKEELED